MSPSADYITHEFAPEYSVVLHLYIEQGHGSAKISKVSFSVLRATEDERHYVTVQEEKDPADRNCAKVLDRFWGGESAMTETEAFLC